MAESAGDLLFHGRTGRGELRRLHERLRQGLAVAAGHGAAGLNGLQAPGERRGLQHGAELLRKAAAVAAGAAAAGWRWRPRLQRGAHGTHGAVAEGPGALRDHGSAGRGELQRHDDGLRCSVATCPWALRRHSACTAAADEH